MNFLRKPVEGSLEKTRQKIKQQQEQVDRIYNKIFNNISKSIEDRDISEELYKQTIDEISGLIEFIKSAPTVKSPDIPNLLNKYAEVSKYRAINKGIILEESQQCDLPQESKYIDYIKKSIEDFKDKVFTRIKEVIDDVGQDLSGEPKIPIKLIGEQSGSYGFIINNSNGVNKDFFEFLEIINNNNIKKLYVSPNHKDSKLNDYNDDINKYIIPGKTCFKIAHPYNNKSITNDPDEIFINETESILLLKQEIGNKWNRFSQYINIMNNDSDFTCSFRINIPITHQLIYIDDTYQRYKNIKYLDIIIMKYCSDGDLFQMLYRNNKIKIPNPINLFEDLSEMIRLLHLKTYAHCDIKLNNIILCDDKYKLIDFGSMMKNTKYYSDTKYIIGTKYYILPLFDDPFKEERIQKYKLYTEQFPNTDSKDLQEKALTALAPSYFNKKSGLQSEFYCYSKFITNCQNKFKEDYNNTSTKIKNDNYAANVNEISPIGKRLVFKSDEYALAVVLRNIYDILYYYKTTFASAPALFQSFIKKNIVNGHQITDIDELLKKTDRIINRLLEINVFYTGTGDNDYEKVKRDLLGSSVPPQTGSGYYLYKSRKYKIYTHNGKKSIKTKNGYVTIKEIEKAQLAKYNNMTTEELKKRVFKNKYATEYMQTHKNNKKSYLTALKYADSLK